MVAPNSLQNSFQNVDVNWGPWSDNIVGETVQMDFMKQNQFCSLLGEGSLGNGVKMTEAVQSVKACDEVNSGVRPRVVWARYGDVARLSKDGLGPNVCQFLIQELLGQGFGFGIVGSWAVEEGEFKPREKQSATTL